MNLIALSIKRPVFAWILMSALIVFGATALNKLGVSQLPDVDFPIVTVSVNFEGAAPEIIEAELVDKIEQQLLSIEGIKEMRSSVRQGSGSVRLEFDISRNVDVALQEVQTAVSQIRFPIGVDPAVVRKQNPEEEPIMFISLSADKSVRDMLVFADTFLLDKFRFVKDVGEVSVAGFSDRNLRVWPHLDKLQKYELTILDVMDAISTQHVEAAAGEFVEGNKELRVRWLGEAYNVDEVKKLRILRRGGAAIQDVAFKIGDVADVEDGLSDIRRLARVDGKTAISISVKKQRGTNEVALSDRLKAKVEALKKELPEGYDVRIRVNFTEPTKAVVHTTMEKLVMAGVVTIVVCFLFLGSWQAAINILLSIPTSIVGTFLIIYFCGFTLNLFTLLALTLAISIVVDDAIMLLENIVRHQRMGKTPARAAYEGSMEILPAATAATLAVVAVFAPVIFMDGVTGKFFFQFGVTMSAAVLLSLLEAVTITPMRAAALMGTQTKVSKFEHTLEQFFDRLAEKYRVLLSKVLNHSGKVVTISMVLFALSLLLIKQVRQEFIPPQDQNFLILAGQLPTGTSLKATTETAILIEEKLKAVPEIASFLMSIGGGGGGNTQSNQIFMPLSLTDREQRKATQMEVMNKIRAALKDVKNFKFSVRDISSRGLTTGRLFPVSFNVNGPDLNVLNEKAQEIIKKLTDEKLIQDGDTDFRSGFPELQIEPLRDKLAARGISVEAVAKTLNAAVAGIRQSRYTSDGRRYDIRVKVPEEEILSRENIKKIGVRNQFGNIMPIEDLVVFTEKGTVQAINRTNRQRTVGVFAQLTAGQSQARVLERVEEIALATLPDGYSFALEGSSAGLSESFKSLVTALLVGILVAYMVLAIQFNSFLHPISVLMALPFSVTGALLALWMFGVSLNLFSFIGLIVLMGIAKKNSILLVEFTNQVRDHKKLNVYDALLEGCPVRLRPILMTSTATVMAAFPLLIGNSLGQETRTPMGLTIVGGTILSTILTLFVVPCIYRVLSRVEGSREVIEL